MAPNNFRQQLWTKLQRGWRSAVAWTFLATLLRVGSSLFVLPLIWHRLPPEHLGLWYVFVTLGSFAALLDFGFEPTVARLASYAWGGARRFAAAGLHQEAAGSEPNRPLLGELVATLRAYYFWVGLGVLTVLSLGGGAWVWRMTAQDAVLEAAAVSLRWAWFVYAFGCCLNFVSGRWPALLNGLGALRESQHIAIISQLVYYLVAVGGLFLGLGLWALIVAGLVMGWLLRFLGRRAFRARAALPEGLPAARFHREIFAAIWPNAWRMGLVSLGAFLIQQSNTLVCSGFLGPKITASYGMSFQMVTLLAGLSNVWVQVKLPLFNQLRVQGRTNEIAHIFIARLRLSLLTYLVGVVFILCVAPLALQLVGSKTTLLSFGPLAVLALIQFLEMHHSLYAQLVFSENHNPFLKPALISGGLIVLLSLGLTPFYGVWGLLFSVGVVQAGFNNWWTVWRGIQGLKISAGTYWKRFFFFAHS